MQKLIECDTAIFDKNVLEKTSPTGLSEIVAYESNYINNLLDQGYVVKNMISGNGSYLILFQK